MNNKISIKQNIANWIEKNKTTYYIISVIFLLFSHLFVIS